MSNKSRLQTNNTNLQALIDKANALPDAGSGGGSGGIDAWTGQIYFKGLGLVTVYYTDINMNLQVTSLDQSTNITIAANTLVTITGGICEATTGCTRLGGGSGDYSYQILSNNFKITVPM